MLKQTEFLVVDFLKFGLVFITQPSSEPFKSVFLHLTQIFLDNIVPLECILEILGFEVLGEFALIHRRTHDDQLGVFTLEQDLPDHAHEEVNVLTALVHFVEHHVRVLR